MLKSFARAFSNTLIGKLRPYRWQRAPGSLLVLTYHRILPRFYDDLGLIEPGMFVHTDTFEMHLQVLRREFELVSLDGWLSDREAKRELPKRACAITFDDGWSDNYQYAFPLLKKYAAPAIIFVVSDLVGTDRKFWPDRLASVVWIYYEGLLDDHRNEPAVKWLEKTIARSGETSPSISNEVISRITAAAKSYDDAEIHGYLDNIHALVPWDLHSTRRDLLNWMEVGEMSESGLVRLGSHTRNHIRLKAGTSHSLIADEIVQSKIDIERNTGESINLFCYPNGDISSASESIVKSHYEGACTVQNGWNSRNVDPFRVRRISVHEGRTNTKSGFLARLSGWV